MQVYHGKDFVSASNAKILLKNNDTVVSTFSDCFEIELSPEKKAILWGEVYSVKFKNGEFSTIDINNGGLVILKEVFNNNSLDDLNDCLEGCFAGVLIDGTTITVFADKFNRTEIFYTCKNNSIMFSLDIEDIIRNLSEIKYLQAALASVLCIYGYFAPKKDTIYQGVKRVGVGESITCNQGKIEYNQKEFIPSTVKNYSEKELDTYSDLFERSVVKRASDHCNWVYLSSGWDSTSIIALLVKNFGSSKIRAVIGEMLYSDRAGTINQFEIDRAKKIADYYGVRLDIIPFDLRNEDSIDYWKNLSKNLKKQHIYSISAFNFSQLNDFVSERMEPEDSIFAGEISDAIHNFGFSQYATILEHPDIGFREYSDKMASYLFSPSFFEKIINNNYQDDFVYKALRDRCGDAQFDDEMEQNEEQRRFKFFASFFLRNTRLPFYGKDNNKMLKKEGAELMETELGKYFQNASEMAEPETLYSWLLYLYNSFYWQGGTVRAFGAAFHKTDSKLKLPFWDNDLHSFLSDMPENWGRGLELKPTKYPLKWMLEHKVDYPMHLQTGPHSYLYDVNPEFSHASELLFGSHLSQHLKKLLKNYPYEDLLSDEFFDLSYLRTIVDDYLNGVELTGVDRNNLMALTTLCLTGWY